MQLESLLLFIIALIEGGVIAYQNHTIRKITEDSIDRLSQAKLGIYYPKADTQHKDYKEEDKTDSIPLEDVNDEDFMKAVRKGVNG